jgi:hypothetical protein
MSPTEGLLLHELGCLELLVSELGLFPDGVPDPDDLVGPLVDGFQDSFLELFSAHGSLVSEWRI